ncbi:MAG: isopeptide-forming domain-containing fimbrial protein [Solobacterium sp.]|nr:isopeptide-forming domain-containing fimbrial protein [Solobacterium sp.]
MKQLKKLLSVLFAFTILMGMSVSVKAEDTYTITITKDGTDKAAHTYGAYQLFKGDYAEENGEKTLSNITWGDNINSSAAITELKKISNFSTLSDAASASDVAKALSDAKFITDSTEAQAVANAFNTALNSAAPKETGIIAANANTGTITIKEAGYYLIKDTEDVSGEGAKTRYILCIVSDVSVTEKASVPSVIKKVDDIIDSNTTEDTVEWQDSADYDIGDAVPFKLTATTASTVSNYAKYHLTFQDKQSAGLTAPTSYTITVLEKTFTLSANATTAETQTTTNGTKITVENATPDTEQTFAIKVTFENSTSGNKIPDEANSKPVEVTYTSVLNENAVFGSTGNPNEVYLKFSNNPYSTNDSEEGTSPTDKVIVFTYKPVITKTDNSGNALAGAGFTLYKKVVGTTVNSTTTYPDGAQTGSAIKTALHNTNTSIHASALNDNDYYVAKQMTLVSGSTNQFEFKGIDDGDYVLVETTIPAGYNAFESKAFTVSATHDTNADNPTLTQLTGENLLTGTVDTGILSADIVNQKGNTLPSTGGIGTTVFYVIGGVLVAGAAVVLIAKNKMSKN